MKINDFNHFRKKSNFNITYNKNINNLKKSNYKENKLNTVHYAVT